MPETLFINACVRENSRTLELGRCLLEKISGEATEVELYSTALPPLDLKGMEVRACASRNKDFSDEAFHLAKQFASADNIVIAAPYWDLMFPAVLKTYLECVSVPGITFVYSENGRPIGLCKAKNLYYITTAGGYIGENNFGFTYIKALAGSLFGIENVRFFSAEGLDISDQHANASLSMAKSKIEKLCPGG